MRPLLPTLKERKRYIVYKINTARSLNQDVPVVLKKKLEELLGVFGMADAGILSVSYDKKTQKGVLRVSNKELNRVKAALIMITHLGRTRVAIRTLGVSGILKKTERWR